jgi:hypothetical protein
MSKQEALVLLNRFLRGFVAGAVASMLSVSHAIIVDWKDLTLWGQALAISGLVGGLTGGLLALDKAVRWEEVEKK